MGMIATLTSKQNEVLDHLIAGHTTQQIVESMDITAATARNHVQAIFDRLGVHSRVEAIAYAKHHDESDGQTVIDFCRSRQMELHPWQEEAIRAAFTPPTLPVMVSGVQVVPIPVLEDCPPDEELHPHDAALVADSLRKVSLEKAPRVRQIHTDKLKELHPQHAATKREIAMRKAALEHLETLTER